MKVLHGVEDKDLADENLLRPALDWFDAQGWRAFSFQIETWRHFLAGRDGLVNAPTGSGKTYANLLGPLLEARQTGDSGGGLRVLWVTPIRALAKEIAGSAERALAGMGMSGWSVGIRTGDTSAAEKGRQRLRLPEILIITPESLHLLMAQREASKRFAGLKVVVADEWHDLLGSKRAVQLELALSRLRRWAGSLRIWGVSATIGNLEEAAEVLVGPGCSACIVRADIEKSLKVQSLMPPAFERLAWAGHLGVSLLEQVLEVIRSHKSTLIFTNTRAQSEIWYHRILDAAPEFAGAIALHHGSISKDLRFWVEDALYEGNLQAVVCTSSLDLGVDFRPVEAVIQIGGPKGVARFVQRAGRSGHQPGATSSIHFLPTHGLELLEGAALRTAIERGVVEPRVPVVRAFDVLVQYLCTLAVGEGFRPEEVFQEIRSTHAFAEISEEEWGWCLRFITTGGAALEAYPDYRRVMVEGGLWVMRDRRQARRHRMSIGTIVGDAMLRVKLHRGAFLGTVEESFLAGMKEGDTFWFAGMGLAFMHIRDMTVTVRKTKEKVKKIPSWMGGRLPLTSELSALLREKLDEARQPEPADPECRRIRPLLEIQAERSHIPRKDELLMELFESEDGHHLCVFPFEGRLVHEGMAMLCAYRLSLLSPQSFSLAYNDYGFELLSDDSIPLDTILDNDLFSPEHLMDDLQSGVNAAELARRRFRDISVISGLNFQGFPGATKKDRHLQSHAGLLFEVFRDYDPGNLLFRQAYEELLADAFEFTRFRAALLRFRSSRFVITHPTAPTPLSFPIVVDRLREKLTSESLADRIKKMTAL